MKINNNYETVAIIFGGQSVEHDISIITGLQVIENIERTNRNILPIFISKSGEWYLVDKQVGVNDFLDFKPNKKVVSILPNSKFLFIKKKNKFVPLCEINCMVFATHGTNCEDGCLAGLLQLNGIAHTTCLTCSSALCMDKAFMKNIFFSENIPHLPFISIKNIDFAKKNEIFYEKIEKVLQYPVIVKPANLGSSIGINVAHNRVELDKAILIAFEFDAKIIVEKALKNFTELNCAVIGNQKMQVASHVQMPMCWNEFLTFEDKYIGKNGGGKYVSKLPKNKVPKSLENEVKNLSIKLYKIFDCSGVVRIDFLYDNDEKKIYANELNTIPGSLACGLFTCTFKQLIEKLIESAYIEFGEKKKIKRFYNSNVLYNYQGGKFHGVKGGKA